MVKNARVKAGKAIQHFALCLCSRSLQLSLKSSNIMSAFIAAIFLLGLCVANAVNFTTVYEWDEFDFVWPSGANSSDIEQIRDNYKPEKIYILFMAVFGERMFLSLDPYPEIPATLVWLPTSDTSTASPKLAPFPSWHLHKKDNCDTIQSAKGIEADTDGQLWVLDNGSSICSSKIWIFDLLNNDKIERVHQFPDAVISHLHNNRLLLDIVIEKTPNDHLAYIVDYFSGHVVVYSRKTNKSWSVVTGTRWECLALSPNKEQLYLKRDWSKKLYSVSVSELKNEGAIAAVKFVGKWTERPYRLLIDSANVMYAAFFNQIFLSKWNISEPFREQRFHEVEGLHAGKPFTFTLDTNGTLWLTERNVTGSGNRHKLVKAAVGARMYLFSPSTAWTTPQAPAFSFTTIVICLLAFFLVLSGIVHVWQTLRMRRMQTSSRQIPMDNRAEIPDDPVYDDVAPENSEPSIPENNPDEPLYSEVDPDYASGRNPSPEPYEVPWHLMGKAKAGKPSEPVYDDVGPTEPDNIYDGVGPGPSSAPSMESVQYLEVLPSSGEMVNF